MPCAALQRRDERLLAETEEDARKADVRYMLRMGKTPEQISDFCLYDPEWVKGIYEELIADDPGSIKVRRKVSGKEEYDFILSGSGRIYRLGELSPEN